MKAIWLQLGVVFMVAANNPVNAEVVIDDQGVSMTKAELQYIVERWPAQMQQDAANDLGARMELLSHELASKKLVAEADQMSAARDGDSYFAKELFLRKTMREYMQREYLAANKAPDMTAVARERYLAEKDKYAYVPAGRLTSHIMLRCIAAEGCDVDATKAKAQQLLEELKAGASFEDMVQQYSQDPGSRPKQGRFDAWLYPKMEGVEPAYVHAAYEIDTVGGYSEVVLSSYGYHIIRLDDERDSSHLSFEEVKPRIVQDLKNEYVKLLLKAFEQDYLLSDEVVIDGEAMEAIFGQYKSPE